MTGIFMWLFASRVNLPLRKGGGFMRSYVIALYIRLSVEDSKTESLSIPNQRLILREWAMSLPEWEMPKC